MEQQTYAEILERMQAEFETQAGFAADDASDIGIRLKVMAGEIFNLYSGVEWLKRQTFPQTATGEFLDLHGEQKGLTRLTETPSTGVLTFGREKALNYALTIPKGTICALSEDPSIRFLTTEEAELPASEFSVNVPAASENGGTIYNVAAGTITQMVTPPTGIETVTNSGAFTNGRDAEDDEAFRKRILYRFANPSNGTNKAFFTNFALQYDGIYSASTVVRSSENNAVQVYVCAKEGSVDEALIAQIQADLNAVKEVNVTVTVMEAQRKDTNFACYIQPTSPYEMADVKEKCDAIIRAYIGELGIGEPFYVAEALRRMMNSGLICNHKLYSYTVDFSAQPNERLQVGSILLTELE